MQKTFEYNFSLAFHEVDRADIMFFAHLFTHAHTAYDAFMTYIGYSLKDILDQNKFLIPITHTEAAFHAPIRYTDDVLVKLNVAKIGTSSITLTYDFFVREQHHASATTRHVFVAIKNNRPCPIPPDLHQAITDYASTSA